MSTRSLVVVAVVGLALAAVGTAFVLTSDNLDNKAAFLSLAIVVGLSFLVSGVIALWRRPDNRTGILLVLVAYFWCLGGLTESENDWIFTTGLLLNSLALGAFVQLLLAYPTGRLHGRRDRWIVGGTYALVFAGSLAQLLVDRQPNPDCPECESTIAVTSSDTALSIVRGIVIALALALVVGVLAIVLTRFLRSRGALRRALAPVLGTGALVMAVLLIELIVGTISESAADPLYYVFLVTFALVPVAFLAGVLRSRLARSGVADLLVELGRGIPLRDALAHALRDPTLEVAYWIPEQERYVTAGGKPLPEAQSGRALTVVEHANLPTATLLHDPMLSDEPELVEAVATAAGLWLDNERLQAKLQAQIDFLETTVETSPALLGALDREGRIANLNVASLRASGYADREEARWQPFWDVFIAPDERESARRRFEAAAPAHEATSFEHTFVNRLGDERTIAWSMAPLLDEQGNVRNVIYGGLDITERERQHRKLQASEERLRAAIDASPVAIVEYALDDTITLWNRAAERIFGWTAEQVVGGKAKHQPPGREAELAELFRRVRAGEIYTGVESTRVRSDGSTVDVAIAAAPIRDSTGRVLSHMALFADITERKRQEQELRASRARIVEAGDNARRQLERNLHDGAQQRLVALSLSLRLAQSKVSTDPAAAEAVLEGAREELAAALDELRELARGIHPAVLTDRGLAAAVETLATRSPVPVEFEAPEEPLPSSVDAAAYYVIAEALANVIKYADATGVNVRVARDDGRAVVTVADDGVGGADPAQGSGLSGLADRVEALGGRLTVESPPGEGTCVTAVIPLRADRPR